MDHHHSNYRKFVLNRVTASSIVDYIENCSSREDIATAHMFHKIMVRGWTESTEKLFDAISNYFSSTVIPVNTCNEEDLIVFHTSNLNLVLKIIKFDFMLPCNRSMFNIDMVFYDKSSIECFGMKMTIEGVVSAVVSGRFNHRLEMDLSNFCNDPDFIAKKIDFYKLSLLSHYKILMLRVGRGTRTLNLSNNGLRHIPVDILNFFINSDLVSVNLSDNDIQSVPNNMPTYNKVEKLWMEGNPLCDELPFWAYIKVFTEIFPRLNELDGVKLYKQNMMLPYFKNFFATPVTRTTEAVEKFLLIYFGKYDTCEKLERKKMESLYSPNAIFTLATGFSETVLEKFPHYMLHSRNRMHGRRLMHSSQTVCKNRDAIMEAFIQFPETFHDPTTFTVDVPVHNNKILTLIVDGIYKEKKVHDDSETVFKFRRTFILNIVHVESNNVYHIINEMLSISFANLQDYENVFKRPKMNLVALVEPTNDDIQCLSITFSQLTKLKLQEAEQYLRKHDWHLKNALKTFVRDLKEGHLDSNKFIELETLTY